MLISNAFAAPATAGPTDALMSFLPLVIIAILFFFMIIRPQMKRAKELRAMLEALQKGDEVITSGGQLGKIVKIGDQFVSLEIADGVVTHVQKATIQTLLPKGTIKGL